MTIIRDNWIRFQAKPTMLPSPSQSILHQSGPRSGKVRRTKSRLKVMMEMSTEPLSALFRKENIKSTATAPIATCKYWGLSLRGPKVCRYCVDDGGANSCHQLFFTGVTAFWLVKAEKSCCTHHPGGVPSAPLGIATHISCLNVRVGLTRFYSL